MCSVAGVISGALLYIRDDFEQVDQSSFLQVKEKTKTAFFIHYPLFGAHKNINS